MGDINLCYSGSFKRFDPVDHDLKLSLTSQSIASQSPAASNKTNNNTGMFLYPQNISSPYGTVCNNDITGKID